MNKDRKAEPIHQPTLSSLGNSEEAANFTTGQEISRSFEIPGILLGTSSFTASGWEGSFYPVGMRSKDFLRHYVSQF